MAPRRTLTSSLLINEPPLQALPSLACLVGLDGAVILQQIHYWLQASDHEHDGFIWIYNSYTQWGDQFRWLKPEAIRKQIRLLETGGFLVSGRFAIKKTDRTKWYRIDYSKLEEALAAHAEKFPHDTENLPVDTEKVPHEAEKVPVGDHDQTTPEKQAPNRIQQQTTSEGEEQKIKPPKLSKVPIFASVQSFLGFPEKTDKDPIPNYGKESRFIDRMKKRGYSEDEILAYWKQRMTAAGMVYVEAWKINEDIGKGPTTSSFRPRQAALLPTGADLEAQARAKGVQV
jgi:hypothetical protein